eukprot:scaffold15943_cov68-Phaeocystis_antarctica.AAC.10
MPICSRSTLADLTPKYPTLVARTPGCTARARVWRGEKHVIEKTVTTRGSIVYRQPGGGGESSVKHVPGGRWRPVLGRHRATMGRRAFKARGTAERVRGQPRASATATVGSSDRVGAWAGRGVNLAAPAAGLTEAAHGCCAAARARLAAHGGGAPVRGGAGREDEGATLRVCIRDEDLLGVCAVARAEAIARLLRR